MGDASSANAELFSAKLNERARLLEQGESATSAQTQTWAPLPTAFDTIVTITRHTVEDETPTRPFTPSPSTVENTGSEAHNSGLTLETETPSTLSIAHVQLCLLLEKEERTVSAGRPRCAVCGIDFTATDRWRRVEHFNQCWSRVCNDTVSNNLHTGHTVGEKAPVSICVLCNTSLEGLLSIDAFEHRVLCLPSLHPLPTVCPKCDTRFSANGYSETAVQIAEHIYVCSIHPEDETFDEVQDAWCERQDARRNPANCAFCYRPLTDLDAVDSLYHRRNCLERTKPAYCPVCFRNFPTRWTPEDILWHVHNCQHGLTLSRIDKDDYELLEVRLAGRTQAIYRMFNPNTIGGNVIGPRKSWGQKEHARSYRSKRAAGRNDDLGLYLTPSTNLRTAAMYAEDDGIGLMKRVRSIRAVWSNLERFRRSACCVYRMPKYGKMFKGMGSEYEMYEVVHNWHEELELPNASTSSTTSSSSDDKEGRGCRRTCGRRSRRASRKPSCESRRTGIRVPPGFESDAVDPEEELASE